MTAQHDKPKWWRPRFSVRTLAIVVTLVCCYAACWGPTKRQGIADIVERADRENVVANAIAFVPLVVVDEEMEMLGVYHQDEEAGVTRFTDFGPLRERYYFWFFGYVAKLPYERELPRDNPQPLDEIIRKLKDEVSGRGGWENHFGDTGEILVWPYDRDTSPQL